MSGKSKHQKTWETSPSKDSDGICVVRSLIKKFRVLECVYLFHLYRFSYHISPVAMTACWCHKARHKRGFHNLLFYILEERFRIVKKLTSSQFLGLWRNQSSALLSFIVLLYSLRNKYISTTSRSRYTDWSWRCWMLNVMCR